MVEDSTGLSGQSRAQQVAKDSIHFLKQWNIKMIIISPAAANGCLFVKVIDADSILTASGGVVSVLSTNSLDIGFLVFIDT